MRTIDLDAKKIVGVSSRGWRIGSEKTGTTEKELVEAPTRKPAKRQSQADTSAR